MLDPQRVFSPDPARRRLAMDLYQTAAKLPIVSPHGHVDPRLFADPNFRFSDPASLLITPDHYVLRLLHAHGISYDRLGVPPRDGAPAETDPRRIWQLFAENFHFFRGTPTGLWLQAVLEEVFGVTGTLSAATAQAAYDRIAGQLADPDFTPRRLYARFGIEALCTTDAAADPLDAHRVLRASGWEGRILPTFRPDVLLRLDAPAWRQELARLSAASGVEVTGYASFVRALEQRREFFKAMGAVASDHGALGADTTPLPPADAEEIFQHALQGHVTPDEAARFGAHMLTEMARMSVEDGLVMQLHVGALRDHDPALLETYGPDLGADIPVQAEFTRALHPLLERFGNDPRLTLILFTLDETTYARELAPLAGYYPAVRLGPPWWFHDSLNGMRRYFDQVMETCGLYKTAGFNDDTHAFASIPARHDLWRRASADWLAGLVLRGLIGRPEADEMMVDMAAGLARKAYKL